MKRTKIRIVTVIAMLLALDLIGASAHASTLTGTEDSDIAIGSLENDTIDTLGANDYLAGMAGNDKLFGGPAPSRNWIFLGAGKDQVTGGFTLDLIIDEDGLAGDKVKALKGPDFVVSFDGAKDNINCGSQFDRAIVDAFDKLKKCENVITVTTLNTIMGTSGNDAAVNGTAAAEYIFGGPGNDTINAGDEPGLGDGDYLLSGGPGADTINGGGGDDFIIDDDGTPGDIINAGDGRDFIMMADGAADTIDCGALIQGDRLIVDVFDTLIDCADAIGWMDAVDDVPNLWEL